MISKDSKNKQRIISINLNDRILTLMIRIIVVLGLVAYIPSMYLSVVESLWVIAVIDTLCYLFFICLAIFKKIPFMFKAVSSVLLCYILGVFLLIYTGPFGAGIIYLLAFIFLSALFTNKAFVIIANTMIILTFLIFGLLIHFGMLSWIQSFESIVVIAANFLLVSLLVSFATHLIMNGFSITIKNQETLQIELKKEIKQRIAAQKELERLLKTKEILLREINHRVKNNLQMILSLVNLRTSKSADPESRLTTIRNSIHTISTVHNMLYKNEDLPDNTDDTRKIGISEILKKIINNLADSYYNKGIIIENKVIEKDILIDQNKAVIIALVVNEILTNSYKHAFPKNNHGKITINLKKNENKDTIRLIIQDNGEGFDKNGIRSSTVGLNIIETLLNQLKARYTLESKKGVKYTIIIPFS